MYGNGPAVDGMRISPDGDRVLAIVAGTGRRALAVIHLGTSRPPVVSLELDAKGQYLDECGWASNRRIVCSMFVFPGRKDVASPWPRRRLVRLVAVDDDGSNAKALLESKPRTPPKLAGVVAGRATRYDDLEHTVVHYLPGDPQHILVAAAREATPYTTVYRVNVDNGSAEQIVGWQPGIVFWHADRSGRVRLGTGSYEFGSDLPPINGRKPREPWIGPTAVSVLVDGDIARLDVAKLSWHIDESELVGPRVLGFSKDGSRVYYEASIDGAERSAVWEADARTLDAKRAIVAHDEMDVTAVPVEGSDCGIVGFMHPLPERPFTWLDDNFGGEVDAANSRIAGVVVAVTSLSEDCRQVVLAATDHRSQRSFHWLDRTTGTVRGLGKQYPDDGGGPDATERQLTRYVTRDGRNLPMTITRAAEGQSASTPVVVLLDGGAPASSLGSLDPWPHFFAGLGYTVIEPTVRGTRGFGTGFLLSGRRQYASGLQDDVQDALGWVGTARLGDPSRVCFVGRGRGGHLALVAALGATGEDPSRRCVAAYAALDMADTKRGHHNPFDSKLCTFFPCGDWLRWAAPDKAKRLGSARREWNTGRSNSSMNQSPLLTAKHPGFPVLIHNAGRNATHVRQSSAFRKDLRSLGFFEYIAPVGSDREVEFLREAGALFDVVLKQDRREPER